MSPIFLFCLRAAMKIGISQLTQKPNRGKKSPSNTLTTVVIKRLTVRSKLSWIRISTDLIHLSFQQNLETPFPESILPDSCLAWLCRPPGLVVCLIVLTHIQHSSVWLTAGCKLVIGFASRLRPQLKSACLVWLKSGSLRAYLLWRGWNRSAQV